MPYTEIAKALEVAEGTVRNRVAKLLENNIFQIIGVLDPLRAGFNSPAIIGVRVQPPHLDDVAEAISRLPEVSYLIMVSGEFDLIVEVLCEERSHLASFIRDQLQQIPYIERTQSFVILHTYKMAHGAKPVLRRIVAD